MDDIKQSGNANRIGVVAVYCSKSCNMPLSNLINILIPFSKTCCLITGNEGSKFFHSDTRINIEEIYNLSGEFFVSRLFRFVRTQVKTAFKIIRISDRIDIWIFFYGGAQSILPLLSAKLSNKKTLLLLPDAGPQKSTNLSKVIIFALRSLAVINYNIIDRIIVYSSNLIQNWNLEPYRHKILIAHEHFLDITTFPVTTPCATAPSSATSAG